MVIKKDINKLYTEKYVLIVHLLKSFYEQRKGMIYWTVKKQEKTTFYNIPVSDTAKTT